jgi:hypothetical protein
MAGWDGRILASGLGAAWRRLGVGGLALILLTLVLPAFADTPQTGADPTVTLTVTPSTALADGQVVTVTGAGFPANTVGIIRECGGTAAAPQCDPTTTTPFVTTAAGTIAPTSFTVKRIVNTGATTFNCGVQSCALVATAGAKSSQHQIRMAGAGTVLTTTSTVTSSTTVLPTTSTSMATTTSSTSTTSTSEPVTTTSTSVPVTTTTVPSTSCEQLRRTQAEANAALDSLIAVAPQYGDVAARARGATNARFAQILGNAGC